LLLAIQLPAAADDVVFNKSSLKYHCPTCVAAIRCTKNCVSIPRDEAIRRGGVACKICNAKCKQR
jgi:hypothetical protein